MKLFQLSKAIMPAMIPLGADDQILLQQDACYLLRDSHFVSQYQAKLCVLAQDANERQIAHQTVPQLTDVQWVELCAAAEVVIRWS